MTRIVYLRRRGETFVKGHGVQARWGDGYTHTLEGEHHAPDDIDYNPFFHDSRTGRMREDIPHMWPVEAEADRMFRHLSKAIRDGHEIFGIPDAEGNRRRLLHPEELMADIKRVLNHSYRDWNNEHPDADPSRPDEGHHLHEPFLEDGSTHPSHAQTTVGTFQDKARRTEERHARSDDGRPITFFAGTNKVTGQPHIESGANHPWRQTDRRLKALGWREHTSAGTKSHIEPGSMTQGMVYRHSGPPSGGGTAPGTFDTDAMHERHNQTRQLGSADPVNILFHPDGGMRLPAAFYSSTPGGKKMTKPPGKAIGKLQEDYGIHDPELARHMAGSAIGGLLLGRAGHSGSSEKEGKKSVGRLSGLVREMRNRLKIGEGERNHDRFGILHSHIERSTNWKGRGRGIAVELAAMLHLADEIGDDLSDFAGGQESNPIQTGVVEAWQRVGPQIAQHRGGSDEGHYWTAEKPETRHPSAQVPRPSDVSEAPAGPRISTHRPLAPRMPEPVAPEPAPEERAPHPLDARAPVHPSLLRPDAPPASTLLQPAETARPLSDLLRAMEDMQLAVARKDGEILKHLPTKRNLNIQNAQDVNLVASRLGVTSGDVHGLYAAGGDWERVAKQFRVAPALVAAVKVAFS